MFPRLVLKNLHVKLDPEFVRRLDSKTNFGRMNPDSGFLTLAITFVIVSLT
jgi:hypothetical protein